MISAHVRKSEDCNCCIAMFLCSFASACIYLTLLHAPCGVCASHAVRILAASRAHGKFSTANPRLNNVTYIAAVHQYKRSTSMAIPQAVLRRRSLPATRFIARAQRLYSPLSLASVYAGFCSHAIVCVFLQNSS